MFEAVVTGIVIPVTAAFIWLVKRVTNDMHADLKEVKEILLRIEQKL